MPADLPRGERPTGTRQIIDNYGYKQEVPYAEPFVEGYFRDGQGKGDGYDIRPQKDLQTCTGAPNADDAAAAVLGQLQARKEANRRGAQALSSKPTVKTLIEALLLGSSKLSVVVP